MFARSLPPCVVAETVWIRPRRSAKWSGRFSEIGIDPTFGLGQRFPWVEQFSQHMLAGETAKAERAIFEFSWKTWSRMAAQFTFSFEAVPLYVARWEILNRWTSRDLETGKERFEQLMQETLGEYAALQF